MILRPQRNFTVVRQIGNHTDAATYYVQAVIRNAYTDAVIDTLQLTDRGSQRFSKNWQVPADPTGEGMDISIVTSVYTDSGYTTKSENYSDEEQTYIIEDKEVGGRGGGSGVDARTIRRILKEEITASKEVETEETEDKKEDMPMLGGMSHEMTKPDFSEITEAIARLEVALKPKEVKPVDFKPILKELEAVKGMIAEKEVTPETDLTPVLDRLQETNENDELTKQEVVELISKLEQAMVNILPKLIAQVLKEATFTIAPTTAKLETSTPKEKVEEPVPFNIDQLTS